MTTCAVGAMLFGGTLGEAHAGVVGLAVSPIGESVSDFLAYGEGGSYLNAAGISMWGPVSFNDTVFGSGSFSQFTASGFSLNAVLPTGVNCFRQFSQRVFFQVTADMNVSYSAFGLGSDFGMMISLHDSAGSQLSVIGSAFGSGAKSGTHTLAANSEGSFYGIYLINKQTSSTSTPGYSGTLHQFSFTAVPAPGAIALLGLAGLAGRRRR